MPDDPFISRRKTLVLRDSEWKALETYCRMFDSTYRSITLTTEDIMCLLIRRALRDEGLIPPFISQPIGIASPHTD